MRSGYRVGRVQVHDGDKGDQLRLEVMGGLARVFRVTSAGDIIIRDLGHMNGTAAHLVITAEDSGIPPRRASVPVTVHFAEDSGLLSSGRGGGGGHNWVMIVVLSLVIVFSLLVILGLGLYICRHRQRAKTRPSSAAGSAAYSEQVQRSLQRHTLSRHRDINHNHNNNNSGKNMNPLAAAQHGAAISRHSAAPRSSSSSTNSSEINFTLQQQQQPPPQQPPAQPVYNPLNPRSGSRRYVKNSKQARQHPPVVAGPGPVSPPPAPPPGHTPAPRPDINQSGLPKVAPKPLPKPKPAHLLKSASTSDLTDAARHQASLQAELKRAILGSSQGSLVAAGARLEWPRASLPRPVKKLSWPGAGDDQDREISTYHYTDPALAVTPAPRQLTLAPGSRHSGTQLEHF